jgi:hypothetical protein
MELRGLLAEMVTVLHAVRPSDGSGNWDWRSLVSMILFRGAVGGEGSQTVPCLALVCEGETVGLLHVEASPDLDCMPRTPRDL